MTGIVEGVIASLIATALAVGGGWFWRTHRTGKRPSPRTSTVESHHQNRQEKQHLKNVSKRLNFFTERKRKRQAILFRQMKESTVFFAYRFSEAFPGCREICEFGSPDDAIHRLDILLRKPLKAADGRSRVTPIWWFRGHSALPVETYQRRKKFWYGTREFYLNEVEHYLISRVIAMNRPSYFRKFVYVEVDGMKPTGVYKFPINPQIKRQGYADEEYGEYGFFQKKYIIREEYDDGATAIKGKVYDLSGKTKLRTRKLSKYNFLIVPHASPINNNEACDDLETLLNNILRNNSSMNELSEYIFRLPKNRMDF